MITYFTPNDFFINRSNELELKSTGYTIVFFTSQPCIHCKNMMPTFLKLSESIQGCTFGIMNVDQESNRIVRMSDQTKNKLVYVPYIVLYVNGTNYAAFDDTNVTNNLYEMLVDFIVKTTTAIKTGQHKPINNVSMYSTGMAFSNKKKACYLTYQSAYNS